MNQAYLFHVPGYTSDAAEYGKVKQGYILAANGITILSIIFLIAILLTAYLSSTVRRTGTWFALLGSWLITNVTNMLLVGQQIGPPPDRGLCLFQTMLMYGNPVLNALTGLGLILEIYMVLCVYTHAVIPRSYKLSFYIVPSVVYVGILIEVLVLGVRNPQWVERDPTGMYCHFSKPISLGITTTIVVAAMLFLLVLEVLIAVAYYKTLKMAPENKDLHRVSAHFNMALRFVIFNSGVLFAVAFGFSALMPKTVVNSARLDLALTSLPLLASIIFGTHKDFFKVWFPCLQRWEK